MGQAESRVHGTEGGYKRGCRCVGCATANRTYMRDYMAKRNAAKQAAA